MTRVSYNRLVRLGTRVRALETAVNKLNTLLAANECASNPCNNGGTCEDAYNSFYCRCPDNWEGPTCSNDVNECSHFHGTDLGCQNGATCVNKPGTYQCLCAQGWFGIHCTQRTNDCSTASSRELCANGICVSQSGAAGFTCICNQGWTADPVTKACTVDVDECSGNIPRCSQNPPVACRNIPGSFLCESCPPGYTGNGFYCTDIDECQTNNGGCSPLVTCTNTIGSRVCNNCPGGYQGNGLTCAYVGGACATNNGGCHPRASCQDNTAISNLYVLCTCPPGFVGSGIGPAGCVPGNSPNTNPCHSNPCRRGSCLAFGSVFHCLCPAGYTGKDCNTEIIACASAPCENGGTCISGQLGTYSCNCTAGYSGRRCSTQKQECGGVLSVDTGMIKFPDSDQLTKYVHNLSCGWIIQVNTSLVINLTFDNFHLETSSDCSYDWLQIHDGRSSGDHLIGRYCGRRLPNNGNILSTTNSLYLWFRSDNTISRDGFQLRWNATAPACGGIINATSHGSLNSPGSPGKYPPNRDCYWIIGAPRSKRIQFTFYSMKIEAHPNCSYDFLAIHDGILPRDPLLAKYCNTSNPAALVTPGHTALVHFHSDPYAADTGFQIMYTVYEGFPGCGGVLTAPQGDIVSPRDPNTDKYKHGIDCEWRIQQPANERIKITFVSFELEDSRTCSFDFLEVREGLDENAPLAGRHCGTTIPRAYSSLGNVLFIRFRADYSLARAGFHIKYISICGGVFSTPDGLITSPQYPDPYPDSRTCIYQIAQPVGKAIKLHFIDFEVEDTSYPVCNFDYLQVRDGDTENSTLIGQYCGGAEKTPSDVVSTYNYMWLQFSTDAFIRNRGFKANYSTIDTLCGGILRVRQGMVSSPLHPETYPHNTVCNWVIVAEPGYIVQLTFISFSLESHPMCIRDYVAVFDNSSVSTAMSMGKFCGSKVPPVLTSSDTTITIRFVTDRSVSREGFTASFITMDATRMCGGNFFTESGVLQSPNYPNDYLHDKDCTWVITAPTGHQIMLNITDFTLEKHSGCVFDYLEIRNGGYGTSPLIGQYCDRNIPPSIPSHGNQLYLHFKSDSSRSAKGFRILWDGTTSGCGGTINSPSGSIISPQYPQPYHRNAECVWQISVSQGSKIELVIVDLDLEAHSLCKHDYLEIHNGRDISGKLIGKYCNTHPSNIVSASNNVFLKFRSDTSVEGRGFHLKYDTKCTTNISGYRGVIASPNFPFPYPGNRDCTWTISVPTGNKINITFSHFATEESDDTTPATTSRAVNKFDICSYDYIQITQSEKATSDVHDPIIGRFCGTNLPPPVYSTMNNVFVHFFSDPLVADIGFRLEWVVNGCGGQMTKPTGEFTSPNYPGTYPDNIACEWIIATDYGKSIELNITDMAFERDRGQSCSFDSLSIYNGEDATAPLLNKYCVTNITKAIVTTSGNVMFLRFESDYSHGSRGFSAKYTTVDTRCGGKLTSPKGAFHSLNYPQNYEKNDDCWWLIEVLPNHLINFQLVDFDVEDASNCSADFFKVYDGNSSSANLLMKHCGRDLPSPSKLKSSTNQLMVHFHTDVSLTAKGFMANYSIGCGARIVTESSGLLSVQDDINVHGDNSNCSWIIVGTKPEDRVSLTVTHMHVSPSEDNEGGDCMFYFVEFLDGETAESPNIGGQFCGSKSPPTLVSSGNAMVVHLVAMHGGHYGQFEATYSVLSNACGGNLSSELGSFATPSYPRVYPTNTECVWTINTAPGNRAQISFSSFDLRETESCNEDYVEIREASALGKMIGIYCKDLPGNITAANSLWIKFRSGESAETRAKGFLASYTLVHGNELTGERGEIASPLYPRPYIETGSFKWRITVVFGNAITIRFTEFYIDKMRKTCSSSLTIYDGFDETAPKLLEICGSTLPDPITSSSNMLYIKLDTDPVKEGTRFLLNWLQVDKNVPTEKTIAPNITGCGGLIDLKHLNGTPDVFTFTSPGYPEGYQGRLDCEWIFETIPGFHVALRANTVDLEASPTCIYDNLQVFQSLDNKPEWNLVKTLCHANSSKELIHSSSLMRVIFHTDSTTNKTGFNATAYSMCGGLLTAPNGVIESNKTNQANMYQTKCQWNITVRAGRKIGIKFTMLNLPTSGSNQGCQSNYVLLKNGGSAESPLLGDGKYCGTALPAAELETIGNRAYINYQVISDTQWGFRLEYREVSLGCGGSTVLTADMSSTIISSPNYPNIPSPNIECAWVIMAPPGEALKVDFVERFDLTRSKDCSNAGVEVRDGGTVNSPLFDRYCTSMPGSLDTTGNVVYVRFFTNVPEPKNGFKANISISRCGGTIRSKTSSVSSPNSPQSYPPNIDCQWKIVGLSGHSLEINFTQVIDFGTRTFNCSAGDYVSISEVLPGNNTDKPLGTFCSGTPGPITTSGNEARITFHSGPSPSRMRSYSGFRLTFNSSRDECGGPINTPTGVIQSLGYPTSYPNRHCIWYITVPKGRRITATVLDMDLQPPHGLYGDRLLFFSDLKFNTILDRMNATSVRKPVVSSSNIMTVVFIADEASVHRGFKLSYTSDERALCGGTLDNTTIPGLISFPLFTLTMSSFYCLWEYTQPANTNQTFTLTVINATFGRSNYGSCKYSRNSLTVTTQDESNILDKFCNNITTPHSVSSPYPGAKIKVMQNKMSGNVTLMARYTTSPCGGVLSGPEDMVMSPGGSDNYPANMDCAWAVSYPDGQAIHVRFTKFDIEQSTNCEHDYLEIRNGPLPTSPVIGRYCGTDIPADINSQSNKLWIDFHSDSANQRPGFSVQLLPYVDGCGGTFHSDAGDLFSPSFPALYPNNAECEWDIRVSEGYTVQLSFVDRFFVEQSPNCTKDFLEVFDFVSDTWKSLGRACGREAAPLFKTSGTRMKVLFRSDNSGNGDGFKAVWKTNCGGIINNTLKGRISSPGYPGVYSGKLFCNYTILAPNEHISTSFETFNLELSTRAQGCRYDNLTVYGLANLRSSEMTTLGTYCGSDMPPPRVFKDKFTIVFQTDDSVHRQGFVMNYEVNTCGGNLTAPGRIGSPAIATSGHSGIVNCTWIITAPADQIVVLRFESLELEFSYKCHYDTVAIYDGTWTNPNSTIGQYCGNMSSALFFVTSPFNRMVVSMRISHYRPRYRFSATIGFTYGEKVGCGGKINITGANSVVRSPDINGDGKYEDYLDCHWHLIATAGETIQFTLTSLNMAPCYNKTFNATKNCTCDYLEIRDGLSQFSNLIGRYCGERPSVPLTSSSNTMWLHFVSDDLGNGAGFQAIATSVPSICGPQVLNVTDTPQVLTSPGYPNNYANNVRCRWLLSGRPQDKIDVHFDQMDIDDTIECVDDSLVFTDKGSYPLLSQGTGADIVRYGQSYRGMNMHRGSRSPTAPLKFCGQLRSIDYYSESNNLDVTFTSNQEKNAKGFKIIYHTAGCTRNYTGVQGRILVNKIAPHCYIIITAPVNHTISVYFSSFQIYSEGCDTKALEIRDGADGNAPVLAKMCSYMVPRPVFSTGSQLYLHSWATEDSTPYDHFDITYTTSSKGRGCGGAIFNYGGTFTSQFYPDNVRENYKCRWDVTVPIGTKPLLKFDVFDIGPKSSCGTDFVELIDVDPDSGVENVRTQLCGEDKPALFEGQFQTVAVRYTSSPNNGGTGWKVRFMGRVPGSSIDRF